MRRDIKEKLSLDARRTTMLAVKLISVTPSQMNTHYLILTGRAYDLNTLFLF